MSIRERKMRFTVQASVDRSTAIVTDAFGNSEEIRLDGDAALAYASVLGDLGAPSQKVVAVATSPNAPSQKVVAVAMIPTAPAQKVVAIGASEAAPSQKVVAVASMA